MTFPCCLGLDTQPTRLGLALVTIEENPTPIWADSFKLRRPGMTTGHAVRAAIRHASSEADRYSGVVVRVGIERAIMFGPHSSLETCWDSGGTYALAIDACQRVWKGTRLRFVPLRVAQWKAKAIGKGHGHDDKGQVAIWARRLAIEAGWDEVRMNGLREHDATDAMGVAVGAVKEGGPA